MKKNIVVIILFMISIHIVQGTELEILNRTYAVMDVRPLVALAGRQVHGKMFSDIPDNSSVLYNSGVYKISGCEVWLKYPRQDGGYDRYYGYMKNWPPIDVFNRNALFELDVNNIGLIYPNKNNREFFYEIELQLLQYDIVGIEKEEGWFLME